MNDRMIPILLSFGAALALGALCLLCIAKPDEVATYVRRRYLRGSKLSQKLGFSNVVLKSYLFTV